jgi:hypothetical protein
VNRALALLLVAAALSGCGGCSPEKEVNRESQRVWGKDKLEQEFAEKAKETIDAYALEDRPELKSRVLAMRFEEVIARLGFVEYTGSARFLLKRNGHTIDVPESSTLRHGLHGSFSMKQLDADGQVTREVIYNNGILYGQNGAKGKMRVMGMIKSAPEKIRDEAWQPLRVFSSYYGPRFGLRKIGSQTVHGRSAANYELVLLDGSPLIEVPGMKGAKKPISLDGNLWIDDGTGVPIKAKLKGQLEIPPEKPDGNPGQLDLSLAFDVKTIEGEEIKPKEFIPEIKRREVDLDPLAFLEGETRTSTVIGGVQQPIAPPPPPPAAPPPPAVEPTKKEEPPPPAVKTTAKKKSKKKKKKK